MKTIKEVDTKPQPVNETDDMGRIVTYRQMFKNAVALIAPKSGAYAIDMFQLGLKLKVDGSDVALEDAEFKLLNEALESNPLNWPSHFLGQALLKLKEAEKV